MVQEAAIDADFQVGEIVTVDIKLLKYRGMKAEITKPLSKDCWVRVLEGECKDEERKFLHKNLIKAVVAPAEASPAKSSAPEAATSGKDGAPAGTAAMEESPADKGAKENPSSLQLFGSLADM